MKNMFCFVCVLTLVCSFARAADAPQSDTVRIVAAANAFIQTLDAKQRTSVQFSFDDETQRARWSNLPVKIVSRAGLSFQELNEAQRASAWALISTALSKRGFEKIQQIVDADEALKVKENNNPMFGNDLYFISFVGSPSEKDPWLLQFGGHHLGLNLTIAGERGVLTPSLTAAQPGTYTVAGKTIRPLGQENDKAFALLNALDDAQRKEAVLNYRVSDLVLGPGKDGKTIQPEGLKASAMNAAQKEMLVGLITEWTGISADSYASARLAEIKAGLDETWFAWSGPTTVEPGKNGLSYYRIQGPKLVIEYAPQRSEEHIHTIYRDPTNDYGRGPVKK